MIDDAGSTLTAELSAYHPLWHLKRINWLEGFGASVPEDEPITTRVFLIDTGVHVGHPYLSKAIDAQLAIDFSALPFGLRYVDGINKPIEFDPEILDHLPLSANDKATISQLMQRASGKLCKAPLETALHTAFPSHGTACAGLIGARMPGFFTDPLPSLTDGKPALAVPYWGVDPLSTIIPVSTSLNPTPGQLILALVYALQNQADVIHLPRGISVAWMSDNGEYDNPGLSLKTDQDEAEWEALEALLFAISRTVPIVCAAGNSGENSLAYPANLSLEDKGENGIISVGALSSAGFRSSYSNYGPGLTVVAPSDDATVFNRYQIRINELGRRYRLHDYAGYVGAGLPRVDFSREAILSTDIPGQNGYTGYSPLGYDEDDDTFAHANDPLQGAFTLFGGTSAASSIVAGVVALMTRRAKMKGQILSGPQLKQILRATARGTPADTKADDINGDKASLELLFGSGLVDAGKAVGKIGA
ncbi:S8 family peptidase [Mesorhizobium cantuariense]|uniref:S8 family serine peptidase n=1 Tax=Mesorhizobium cantuariense TaxID=1300275 RepID=A0ABV7MSQ2_9HYPH